MRCVPRCNFKVAPGQRSLNASAFKYFSIYERLKAELRLEAIGMQPLVEDRPGYVDVTAQCVRGMPAQKQAVFMGVT